MKDSTSKLLAAVVVLQGLTLAIVLTSPTLPAAHAQVPPLADAGLQRTQAIEEQKKTNDRLDRIIAILEGGKLQVKVEKDDEKAKR